LKRKIKIREDIIQKEITPAKTIIILFERGCLEKLPSPISPSILTKAPNGKRFIEYKVSPIFLPKNSWWISNSKFLNKNSRFFCCQKMGKLVQNY